MNTQAAVRKQYEDLPYPPRDPRDELRRLMMPALDDLDAVNHYGFGGRRDFHRPLRVLVAGGGTGDSTVFLAHQLALTSAEIVHLDVSRASIDVARRRLALRGLDTRVRFVQASLLDLDRLDLGQFDYINCSGVLHHLDAPERGMDALTGVLAPGGVVGLMVYAAIGRRGVYVAQRILRILTAGVDDTNTRIRLARTILDRLPPWHPLRRMGRLLPDLSRDAELQDMFLHATDRAYTMRELETLVEGAGLQIAAFSPTWRALHDLELAPIDGCPLLAARLAELAPETVRALAESYWGLAATHECYLVREADTVARADDAQQVPFVRRDVQAMRVCRALAEAARRGDAEFAFDWQYCTGDDVAAVRRIRLTLDARTRAIIERIDGQRSIGRIVEEVAPACGYPPRAVARRIEELVRELAPHDCLLLRHKKVRPLEWSAGARKTAGPKRSTLHSLPKFTRRRAAREGA